MACVELAILKRIYSSIKEINSIMEPASSMGKVSSPFLSKLGIPLIFIQKIVKKIYTYIKKEQNDVYELLKSLFWGFTSIIAMAFMGRLVTIFISIVGASTEKSIKIVAIIDTAGSVAIFTVSTLIGVIGFTKKRYNKMKYQVKEDELKLQNNYLENEVAYRAGLLPVEIENLSDHVAKIHIDAANKIGNFNPED